MTAMPSTVAEIRHELCPECTANHLDPCAACPHGKWGPYVRCEPDLPPPLALAANFGKAIASEAVATVQGVPKISAEQAASRLAICQACSDWFRPSDQRCAHPSCGCFLREKTTWRAQRCPAGKW